MEGAQLEVEERENVYDAVLYKLIDEDDLSADTIFECLLVLPDTDFQLIQRLNFQPSKFRQNKCHSKRCGSSCHSSRNRGVTLQHCVDFILFYFHKQVSRW